MFGDLGDVEDPKNVPSSAAHGLNRALSIRGDLEPQVADEGGDFNRFPKMPEDVVGVLGADSLDGERLRWLLPDRLTWRRPKGERALPWRDRPAGAGSSTVGSSTVGGSLAATPPDAVLAGFPTVRIRGRVPGAL